MQDDPPPLTWKRATQRTVGLTQEWPVAARCLIYETVAASKAIARSESSALVMGKEAPWPLLLALERSHCRPTISDLGRRLGVSRQAAQRLVHRTAEGGHIDLLTNDEDRRIVQARLNERGRAALRRERGMEAWWVSTLLNGFDIPEMRRAAHLLYVVRRRLLRDEDYRRLTR